MPSQDYDPDFFQPIDLDHAKSIILGAPDSALRDQRWAAETKFLGEMIPRELELEERSLVLDFGCGIGRVAQALIEACNCNVLGIDINPGMLELAMAHVASPRFAASSRFLLTRMIDAGLRVDHAIAIWVLQHSPALHDDVALLHQVIVPGGLAFIANANSRCIPTTDGLHTDGLDVAAALAMRFSKVADIAIPDALVDYIRDGDKIAPVQLNQHAFVSVWRRPENAA